MKRSYDAVAPSHERPLILKVGDQVDLGAMADADTHPVALYYRSNTPESVFPLRLVMLIALFVGCGGVIDFAVRFSMQEIAHVFLHLAGL